MIETKPAFEANVTISVKVTVGKTPRGLRMQDLSVLSALVAATRLIAQTEPVRA